MKLKNLGDLLVFDTFPLMFNPKQKIILTHLLHLEEQMFPQKLSMIFTTQKLADQLRKYCCDKKHTCINKSNIIVVKPYEFIDIVLDRQLILQVLFCASEEEESNNVMVLIRENGKLNYIYGGNFIDIRSALLNDTFASWISHGVEKLYVNLKRMEENHTFNDIDQMEKVFNNIEAIMKNHRESKIHLHLPLFGYEVFILKLAERFPNRLKYSNLKQFYINLDDDNSQIAMHCLDDKVSDERIILQPVKYTSYQAYMKFKKTNEITINICHDAINCMNSEIYNNQGYYELFYSPEPSPFHLKLLCMLVKPKRIFGIVDTFNNKSIVPKYLYELCVGAKEKIKIKEERKLSYPFQLPANSKQQPMTIIAGHLSKTTKKTGPYLTDSESDGDT
ncbi:uncharacterized protein LOC135958655 [Calliphora vicina]|uniref:uncharacterized protein LOC135958655 n=1 Tax=Calliphora vicina TaxID=7373 RepID=UPI00325AE328